MAPDAMTLVLAAIAAWIAIGALGIAAWRRLRFVSRVLFPSGAAIGVLLAVAAFAALDRPAHAVVLPIGLPDLPFHLRLDALSASFIVLLGAAG